MDRGLETAEETRSLMFLVGDVKTCNMERKGKRKDIEEEGILSQ